MVSALAMTCLAGFANNPVAQKGAVVEAGKARFTVLTPEMIRVEYSDKSAFEDNATMTIVNRDLPVPRFSTREDSLYLYIDTDNLALKYRKGADIRPGRGETNDLTITLVAEGPCKGAQWHPGLKDPYNLKGTTRTLDRSNGDNKLAEMEDGLISRTGWAVIDDSWNAGRPDSGRNYAMKPEQATGFDWWTPRQDKDALDLYFFGYGHDYKKAIGDYTRVAGKIPLPPDYVFGYWYSKYSVYSADDFRGIMDDIESNGIPADVMILDMDWHWNRDNRQSDGKGGWTGWSWNTNLIPNPTQLLGEMHDRGFRTALNLHPADGVNAKESPEFFDTMKKDLVGRYLKEQGDTIAWALDFPDFTNSFFNNVIATHEREGVDFWWIDWQQHLTSNMTEGLSETFWCNHVFFNKMKNQRAMRRPVIFHRWGGLGSHRYQIGFSGDAFITFPTLAFQPWFTATASNVCYGYWGHDLGGHMIDDPKMTNDPDLVSRWLQFGVFTPIFRTHATNDPRIERRIWKFDNFPVMLDAVKLRYALFPYIYAMARKAYDTGISLCRPLYYEYPEINEAYEYKDEYFFGDDMLVAPITTAAVDGLSTRKIWFPSGGWWSVADNRLIEGPTTETMSFGPDKIPYFIRQGAMIPNNPPEVKSVTERPEHLIINAVCGDGGGSIYEDAGNDANYAEEYAVTPMSQIWQKDRGVITIGPRKGEYRNMPLQRAYTLKIYGAWTPGNVVVNGKITSDWRYDADQKCLEIQVPKLPCSEMIAVDINR